MSDTAWFTRRSGETSTAWRRTVPCEPIRVESSRGPVFTIASTRTWIGFWSLSRWMISNACATMRTAINFLPLLRPFIIRLHASSAQGVQVAALGRGSVPVDEALDDRHLRLLELALRVAAGGVREVDGMADLDVVRERDVLDLDAARARRSAPARCRRARGRHALLGLPLPEQLHLRAELRDLLREGGGHRVCAVRGRDGGGGGEEEVGGSRELYSFYSGLRALPFCQTGISRTLCCCTEHNAKVLFHWLWGGFHITR
jgi:hypothetical protein